MLELAQEKLKEILDYDQETGIFTWKRRARDLFTRGQDWKRWNNRYCGTVAGSLAKGYVIIQICGKDYSAHRLAWLYIYGHFPNVDIDHINHNRSDNRIINLRLAGKENCKNLSLSKLNTSGYTGVRFHKGCENFISARICVNRKEVYLGGFKTFEEAVLARKAAEIKYGFHKNHGKNVA